MEEDIARIVSSKDFRLTARRGTVLKVFMKNPEGHLTAEDVYKGVKTEDAQMGKATVYRTLDLLVELGILNKLAFPDGKLRYELNNEEKHNHHHLICIECGQVYDFRSSCLEDIENEVRKAKEFTVLNHQLNFHGICKYCKAFKKEVYIES